MKFLCVTCDKPMQLKDTISHDDIGSLSVVYECGECGQKTAMLTNPHETQMVTSLGVKIGAQSSENKESAGCPFAKMLAAGEEQSSTEAAPAVDGGLPWSVHARDRLDRIPEVVRPMARMGIEKYAVEKGYDVIDEDVLEEAKENFGM